MDKLEKADSSLLRSKWPLLFLFITVALAAIYGFRLSQGAVEPGSGLGLAYGVAGFILVLFLAAYKIRKSVLGYGLGRMNAWLQAHIYISVICAILVIMHSGFRFSGPLSGLCLALFMLVVASGITGSLMYKVIPISLSKYGGEILTTDDVVQKIAAILEEADKMAEQTSDKFKDLYQRQIRPLLAKKRANWNYLFMEEREIIDRCESAFERLKALAPAGEIYDLNLLSSLYVEKEKLVFKWVKLLSLSKWMDIHIPLTSAMLAAAVLHIFSTLYY